MNENDWKNAINHAEYKGELKSKERIARNLLTMGMPPSDIAKATGLSESEIAALK